jgi:prolyl-tRNA synthetase
MAPFDIAIVPLNMDKSDAVAEATEALYAQLIAAGIDVFLDDRKERPGVKFAEMELVGMPLRVTIGDRSLAEGNIELQLRTANDAEKVPVSDAYARITAALAGYQAALHNDPLNEL